MMNSDGGTTAEKSLLRIHFLHAGYSDCILIECRPDSLDSIKLTKETPYKSMLIDGGMAGKKINQVVHNYCSEHLGWELGRKFDYLLVTHSHADHVKGITTQKIKAKHVIDSGFNHNQNKVKRDNSALYRDAPDTGVAYNYLKHISDLKNKTWKVPPFCPNDIEEEGESNTPQLNINGSNDISFHWLFAAGVFNTPAEAQKRRPVVGKKNKATMEDGQKPVSPNLFSLGFILKWKNFLFYSGGDAYAKDLEGPALDSLFNEETAPAWMKDESGNLLKIAVFKSSHHGSATSVPKRNDKYWLEVIQPDTVVTLTNFDFTNLPCEEFAESLLATSKAIASTENLTPKEFAAYFTNHFDISTAGKTITQKTYNKLRQLSNLENGVTFFSNLSFSEEDKKIKKLTNKIPADTKTSLIPVVTGSIQEQKKRKESTLENEDPEKKKKKTEAHNRLKFEENSKTQTLPNYTYSPLSLIIELSDQTMDRSPSHLYEEKIDEKSNYFLRRQRRLHNEILLYRRLDDVQVNQISSPETHERGFVVVENFENSCLYFEGNTKQNLYAGRYPLEGESEMKDFDEIAYFVHGDIENQNDSVDRRILVDPFRRYLWLKTITQKNAALSQNIFAANTGHDWEIISNDTNKSIEESLKRLEYRLPDVNGDAFYHSANSDVRKTLNDVANQLANLYINQLWMKNSIRRDFKPEQKDSKLYKVMKNLVMHPFFGVVACQYFCGIWNKNNVILKSIVNSKYLDILFENDFTYRQSIGITNEVFNINVFYDMNEVQWGCE